MHWLLIAQLLALTFVSAQPSPVASRGGMRQAWFWLSLAPLSQFAMALFRAGNMRSSRDLALVEVWANGFVWLFLGLSIVSLGGSFRKVD